MKHLITSLVLACVLIQTVFGGHQDRVVICLGGGHDHHSEVAEAPTTCCQGCSHQEEWPATTVDDNHDNCGCTDIELTLIELFTTPRPLDSDQARATAPTTNHLGPIAADQNIRCNRGPPAQLTSPPQFAQHTAGAMRLAIVRSTRWLL